MNRDVLKKISRYAFPILLLWCIWNLLSSSILSMRELWLMGVLDSLETVVLHVLGIKWGMWGVLTLMHSGKSVFVFTGMLLWFSTIVVWGGAIRLVKGICAGQVPAGNAGDRVRSFQRKMNILFGGIIGSSLIILLIFTQGMLWGLTILFGVSLIAVTWSLGRDVNKAQDTSMKGAVLAGGIVLALGGMILRFSSKRVTVAIILFLAALIVFGWALYQRARNGRDQFVRTSIPAGILAVLAVSVVIFMEMHACVFLIGSVIIPVLCFCVCIILPQLIVRKKIFTALEALTVTGETDEDITAWQEVPEKKQKLMVGLIAAPIVLDALLWLLYQILVSHVPESALIFPGQYWLYLYLGISLVMSIGSIRVKSTEKKKIKMGAGIKKAAQKIQNPKVWIGLALVVVLAVVGIVLATRGGQDADDTEKGIRSEENSGTSNPSSESHDSGSAKKYKCDECRDTGDCDRCTLPGRCEKCLGNGEIECPTCRGTNQCGACDGNGGRYVGTSPMTFIECGACDGDMRCGRCNYGKIDCGSCDDGRCKWCKGTGYCRYCN